jgi:hypothetical protein
VLNLEPVTNKKLSSFLYEAFRAWLVTDVKGYIGSKVVGQSRQLNFELQEGIFTAPALRDMTDTRYQAQVAALNNGRHIYARQFVVRFACMGIEYNEIKGLILQYTKSDI